MTERKLTMSRAIVEAIDQPCLVVFGTAIDAREAERIGLANRVVYPQRLAGGGAAVRAAPAGSGRQPEISPESAV